ncbi:cyclin-L1 isoform X2 [Labeo rohita]|uniref:Cyclin-L1 isoform X2 n=1 Tax=Labeo rohita TaxID=84645 RepID=A0A498LQC2_LABRO|nr:cyclin-L1 isoform X2 [Labeo rohita]
MNTPPNSQGILIGDKVYSEVFLAIDSSIIPEERLSTTPSMLDGLDHETETDLRILGCELIQSAGILLRLPQVAMATGQVLFQRFFYSKSFIKHSFEIVAMACVNLASKIEESPRRVRDVINVFHHLKQGKSKKSIPLVLDQNYINTKNQVIKAERRVLKELGFCVHVKHPHKIIVMYLQVLECEKNQMLVQTAWVAHGGKCHRKHPNSSGTRPRNPSHLIGWPFRDCQPILNYMNDTLRTNVFVRFEPETIACACIYLAARVLQIPLPSKPHWYLVFGASKEDIKEICISTMKLYSREKPNSEQLEKQVEKRKVALEEARLKAKGQNPSGTPALAAIGGFSPASKPFGGATQEHTALRAATAHRHGNTKVAELRQLHSSGRSETDRASLVDIATTKGGDHGADLAATPANEPVTATTRNTRAIAATTGIIVNVNVTVTDHMIMDEANTRAGHILDTATADTEDETYGTAERNRGNYKGIGQQD